MADSKITGLTADTAPTTDDLVVTVNDPAGTPANKKVTVGNLLGNTANIAAQTALVGTSQTTTSTSYTDLATSGPAVTITTGSQALVSIFCGTIQNDTAADYALATFAVSGATTIAAADTYAIKIRNAAASVVGDWGLGATFLITGLTPGSNVFTMKYRAAVGGTATFATRQITVLP